MKNKTIIFLAISICIIVTLAGCSQYEKDSSYDTDLFGVYSNSIEASNVSYSSSESYTFNTGDTYNYIYKEIIDGVTNNDFDINGKILSTEKISDDIIQIALDREITEWSTGETSNQTIYKYKNMLGSFYETEVPKGKTFELHLNDYVWYDKDGQYHLCDGSDNCDCSDSYPKYIRKDDIIYFQSIDEEHKDCYTIAMYIVDDGLFFPEAYKEK